MRVVSICCGCAALRFALTELRCARTMLCCARTVLRCAVLLVPASQLIGSRWWMSCRLFWVCRGHIPGLARQWERVKPGLAKTW